MACQGYLTQTGAPFTGTCERACAMAGSGGNAPTGMGGACMAYHGPRTTPSQVVQCGMTLDYGDFVGCCATATDGKADVEFFVCF
jgi:hypothetical protein